MRHRTRSVFATVVALSGASLPAYAQQALSVPQERAEKLEPRIGTAERLIDGSETEAILLPAGRQGEPRPAEPETGWSLKPRGRIHFDTAYIATPGQYSVNPGLGSNTRLRRFRLGVEGSIPGGFGYVVEADFANADVRLGNVNLTYRSPDRAWMARVGNLETLSGLDQQTSSNMITFLERAQFNDAFINTRRVGAAFAFLGAEDRARVEVGLFASHSIDASYDNDGWLVAARAVYVPVIGNARLHVAINFQRREFDSNSNDMVASSRGSPSANQLARYRARPFLQTTNVRFVDTGTFAARGDDILGLELAGVLGRLHFASEAQWLRTRSYRPGDVSGDRRTFVGEVAITPRRDPRFFGIYGEVGWFITGETRGYRDNLWARTTVRNPVSRGGAGAWQIAARVDHLDLASRTLKDAPTNNFATGIAENPVGPSRFGRGGKQTGMLLALNWHPVDYVRVMLNYIHIQVEGGPLAAVVKSLPPRALDQRSYATDAVALRFQVDF